MQDTLSGIKAVNLREKLFRLKNIDGLQDTEENQDDSELKVTHQNIIYITHNKSVLRPWFYKLTFRKILRNICL